VSNMNKLKLLVDNAIRDKGDDHFYNRVYSDLLSDVINSTPSGSAVALFGKWGQGKTSIINMLEETPPINTKIVVFNAWKSRGDTVRRQLLLHVLKEIKSPLYKDISHFVEPGIPLKIRTADERDSLNGSKLWWILTAKEKLDVTVVVSIAVFLVSLIVMGNVFWKATIEDNPHQMTIWSLTPLMAIVASCMTAVYRWFSNRKQLLLTSAEPVSDSQRLKYPEQFQRVFEKEVDEFCQGGEKLVVIIDDLDRCEPSTVVEALSAIRQFSGAPGFIKSPLNCQFIVPCDEKQVVLALESAGHDVGEFGGRCHDYRNEELLRKFFDIVVRMDAPLHQDMLSYAEKFVEDKKISLSKEEAREVVSLANAQDPREVKKLLNALIIAQVKRKKSTELLPSAPLEKISETERFLVVLREKAPLAYEALAKYPGLLQSKFSPDEDDEKPDKWTADQFRKAKHLLKLQPISIPTAIVLLHGRLDNELRDAKKSAGMLVAAVASNDPQAFVKAMKIVEFDEIHAVEKWVSRLCRELRAIPDARRILLHLFEYRKANRHVERKFFENCLAGISKSSVNLANVMEEFGHSLEFISELPMINRSIAESFLAASYSAFSTGGYQDDEALKLLLGLANICDQKTRRNMSDWMEEEIGNDKNILKFSLRLEGGMNLGDGRKYSCGAFPKVAERLAALNNWPLGDDNPTLKTSANPVGNLISLFAGEDKGVCTACLDAIFSQSGMCAQVRAYNENQLSSVRSLWKTIGDLMSNEMPIIQNHAEAVNQWLGGQTQQRITWILLVAVWPYANQFPAPQQEQFLKQHFINNCFGTDFPTEQLNIPDCKKKAALDEGNNSWKEFLELLLSKITTNRVNISKELPSNVKGLFDTLSLRGWRFQIVVDKAVAYLLNSGQILQSWLQALMPLGQRYPETEKAICHNITNNSIVIKSIRVGLKTAWKKSISGNSAKALGYALLENYVDGGDVELWSEIFTKKNSTKIAEATVIQLKEPKYGIEWLNQHKDVLVYIAKHIGGKENLPLLVEFCEPLKRLMYDPDLNNVHIAAIVAANLPYVTKQLSSEMSKTYSENQAHWKKSGRDDMINDFKKAIAVKAI